MNETDVEMDKATDKKWVAGWLLIVMVLLIGIGTVVYRIDPYFHYRKPQIQKYFYTLKGERFINDGIVKHFDYDAIITGTSMTQNFKTSEFDDLYDVHAIKVPFSGASYKEINDNLKAALQHNPNVKKVLRGLDTGKFLQTADDMRYSEDKYPRYLYDDNPVNDVRYLWNKDVLCSRIYQMVKMDKEQGISPGITSFDEYSFWGYKRNFGLDSIAARDMTALDSENADRKCFTEELKESVRQNITRNVTEIADQYPNVEFYYFFTPYSILWYRSIASKGELMRHYEAEKYIIELILSHDNIKLFSFNGEEDIITDINNYRDKFHYGPWINSYMLHCMSKDEYRLTQDNYMDYLHAEYDLIGDYDYSCLNTQEDYAQDKYAAALMNERIWEVQPIEINMENLENGKIKVPEIGHHNYLSFEVQKMSNQAEPGLTVEDENEVIIGSIKGDADRKAGWDRYVIDLSAVTGDILLNFGDSCENSGVGCIYRNAVLY